MLRRADKSLEGFVLLESLLSLFVFSVITISLIPLILFMKEQKYQREFRLEAGRFAHEIILQGQEVHDKRKQSGGFRLLGNAFMIDGVINHVEVVSEDKVQHFSIYETGA